MDNTVGNIDIMHILSMCFPYVKHIHISLNTTECFAILIQLKWINIWAVTWFPTMWYFNKCRLIRPAQPPFKVRNSKWCWVSSSTIIEYSSDKQRLWSDCAYAQADQSLYLLHIPHCYMTHIKYLLWLAETSLHWLWHILMSNSDELRTG